MPKIKRLFKIIKLVISRNITEIMTWILILAICFGIPIFIIFCEKIAAFIFLIILLLIAVSLLGFVMWWTIRMALELILGSIEDLKDDIRWAKNKIDHEENPTNDDESESK